MTTDTTLAAWIRWLEYAILRQTDSVLAAIPIRLRDTEDLKEYPGIYIEEGGVDRIESGGIKDGNAWEIEVLTKLVTTPGDEGQEATTKAAHDILRNALTLCCNDCGMTDWLDSQVELTCFQAFDASPKTTDEDGYRVTTWANVLAVCLP